MSLERKVRTIKRRWKSESPVFFKKITNVCAWLGGIGVSIIALPVAVPIALPAGLITLGSYLVVTGTVGGAISKLTVQKPLD